MPPRAKKKPEYQTNGGGITALIKELWQAAVNLRGSVEPADYKRYVLSVTEIAS
jgi:type I restriction enzyme M protein